VIEADEESTSAAQDTNRSARLPVGVASTSSEMVVSIVPYSWEPPVVVARWTGGREAKHSFAIQLAQPSPREGRRDRARLLREVLPTLQMDRDRRRGAKDLGRLGDLVSAEGEIAVHHRTTYSTSR
jgi:hypothetical protein